MREFTPEFQVIDLDHLIDMLEVLADWRAQLDVQIKRASVLFDLGLLDDQALDQLTRRVHLWCRAAKVLDDAISERGFGIAASATRKRCRKWR